ncbi:Mitochodrial transcription termination factor-related [Spatholobus suberectus]|nr:Mitochodrial transcription termination factor-related [Spatholobus suberectus]
MLNTLLYLKGVAFTATSRYPLIHHSPLLFSLRFCTTTSNSRSFAVSYLIHNFGFSPESASKTSDSYHICFRTPEKPDSVIRFFRDRGFSNSQINNVIRKAPWLLSCDPCKRVLPKFEFLLSKGVSSSEIVDQVSKYPRILTPSLKNHIVPTYELVYRFLQSDKNTVACMFGNSFFSGGRHLARNIRVMLENGVTDSNIARLLRNRCKALFGSTDMLKAVEEVKDLGFDPSKAIFAIALLAIKCMSQTRWKEKVDTFKKWGWSDEAFLEAFMRHPHCVLASTDKINIVMSFWVNQMSWDALSLVEGPKILG